MVMDMDMAMVTIMERDLLKPSQDMDIMAIDMVMDMAMVTTDIMASVPLSQLPLLSQLLLLSQPLLLNLQLLLSLDIFMVMDMVMDTILAMDMVDTDFMDSMARDLLSQDMATMVVDMAMDTMDTMARDLLMPSQDMDIMAMDMDTMDMVMAMVMDSMVKQICCSFLEFSTNEVDQRDPVKRNTLFIQLKYILK